MGLACIFVRLNVTGFAETVARVYFITVLKLSFTCKNTIKSGSIKAGLDRNRPLRK